MRPRPAATIRLAVDDDLDRVVDLVWHVAAEGRWIGAEVPFDRQARRRRYVELLADADSALFVADASASGGPAVVGELTVSVAAFGVAELAMMVADEWRGRGLGRALLDAAISWARGAGAHKMWLEVWPHNTAAIALYRRAGFAQEGRKDGHYRRRNGERWDALLMGLHLDQPITSGVVTDWRAWHSSYEQPDTSLARRLTVVRQRIAETFSSLTPEGSARILSLCAGEGRDVLPELAAVSHRGHRAVLVEKDDVLAANAMATARSLGVAGVNVIVGDAGKVSTFSSHLPVDLLLLCGIFGNISEHDIRATISATPAMVNAGGTVIWTRGASEPDLRPLVRAWFAEAGWQEVSFDSEPESFGVGVALLTDRPATLPSLGDTLFTFIR